MWGDMRLPNISWKTENPLNFSLAHEARVSPATHSWIRRHAAHVLLAVGAFAISFAGRDGRVDTVVAQNVPAIRISAAALEARSEDGNTASLPLIKEGVSVRIDDGHATSTYDHSFQNESTTRLEGNYRLTVADGATATGFAYWNGTDKIVGEIFEREAARQVYEAITGLRRDPGLLEQTGEGSFSFRVFPIAPGETKHVQVTTSHWLQRHDGALEYRARIATPPAGRNDADLKVEIADARGVDSVESTTHEITTEPITDGVRVKIGKPKVADGGELVVRYKPKESPMTLRVATHKDASDAYFMATLDTPVAAKSTAKVSHDVTLVLDRSGSMEGTGIEAAKTAARKLVEKLDEQDAVNVILFDDKVEPLWPAPRVLDAKTRKEADAYIASATARGGTEIAKALEKALASQTKDARPDVVLFLTDGQSDGPSAVAVATKDTSATRVFTVGLGSGVDKALLTKIAAEKHGRFTFVADAKAVEAEFSKVLGELEPPMLTNVKIRAEGMTITQMYPSDGMDLFADDQLRIFGRASGSAPGKIIVDAQKDGVAMHIESAVDATKSASHPYVARSWARSRVDDLLEAEKTSSEAKVHDEIVDLGLAWSLVTPYTSFLAIPEKDLTEAAKDARTSMRERKAKLLAANKDAANLSRMNMPPGDPILKVRAPHDAARVTALFPFGLTQDLAWDDTTEQWTTRFLVPTNVADGVYEVPIVIVLKDGKTIAAKAEYTIDSNSPKLDVQITAVPGGAFVRVLLDETGLEVRAAEDGHADAAIMLATSIGKRAYEGTLRLGPGHHVIRIVVADAARNEADRTVEIDL
jgi:Ca-activated chloride channel family protein